MASPIALCDTAGMSNKRWLECRMHGPKGDIPYTVGGSDVAAIFGVSPWTTPLELWMIKKGRMKPPAKSNANQLEMGHLLEPIAAHWYAKKTGNHVYEDTNLHQHADHPYALANFDRRFNRADDGEPGILECKSCTYHKASEWADDSIPLYYELQLRFYLSVADVNIGAFSAVWGNNPDNDLAMPKMGFLSDPKYMGYKGFQRADAADPYFELMYLPFEEGAKLPRFRDTVGRQEDMPEGFVLYYTNQCPFTAKYVPMLEQMAEARNVAFLPVHMEDREAAQKCPSPFTTFSLFYDGQFVTHEILSEKKFDKILASKGLAYLQ